MEYQLNILVYVFIQSKSKLFTVGEQYKFVIVST